MTSEATRGVIRRAVKETLGVIMSAVILLVVWATASNAYFSLIVRIQTERGIPLSRPVPISSCAIQVT